MDKARKVLFGVYLPIKKNDTNPFNYLIQSTENALVLPIQLILFEGI